MEKHIKAKIDKLVEVFLNQLLSADSDAGWLNCSQWESMMNEVKSTAGDKDLRMVSNIELLRNMHHDYPMAVTALFRGIREEKHRIALLAHCYYEGKVAENGKMMTRGRVAKLLGCTMDQYQYNKKMAYQKMEMAVIMLMDYDHNKGEVRDVA